MAAVIPSLAYLIRSGSNSPANTDFTVTFWARRTSSLVSGYRVYFNQLDTGYTEWVGIFGAGSFALGEVGIDASNGGPNQDTDVYASQLNEWSPYAYVRSGTTHSFYQGGRFVGSTVLDTSANVLDEQRINYDGFGSGAAQYMYLREWGTALTLAELVAEWNSPTNIKTANLWSDCPLLTDENDISGNGRDYTITGAVTFVTGPTPVPLTNTTSGTAYDVTGTLPLEFVQVVHLAGTTEDNLWFKRTVVSADGNELGALAYGGGPLTNPIPSSKYAPKILPYDDGVFGGTILGIPGSIGQPVQIPVTIGLDYYFKALTNNTVTNPTPAVLYFRLTAAPLNAFVTGDIYVNDDTTGFPSVILSSTTDFLVKRFYPGMPAGEAGDIVSNGNFLLDDIDTNDYHLFDISSNLLLSYSSYGTFGYCIRTHRATDSFYICEVRNSLVADLTLKNYSNTGVEISSQTLVGITRTEGIAVNNDQTILYYVRDTNGAAIKRYDLINNVILSDLVAGIANYSMQDILNLEDDTVVAIYFKSSSVQDVQIKHYDDTGATLNTYSLAAYIDTGSLSFSPRLAYALDSPNSFWTYVQQAEIEGVARFINIKVSDGSILTNRQHSPFEFGTATGTDFTFPPVGDFGPSESCPFFILPEPTPITNSLQIFKVTVPPGSVQSFNFTTSGGLSPSTFALLDGENQLYLGLADGVYGVTEDAVLYWTTEYVVSNGDPHDAIDLAGGESVTVIVTNTFLGLNPLSGIYKIVPYSYKSNDTVYTSLDPEITEDRAIPRPTFRTALLGK